MLKFDFYAMSKKAIKKVREINQLLDELNNKYSVVEGLDIFDKNNIENNGTASSMISILMPNDFRKIATYYPTKNNGNGQTVFYVTSENNISIKQIYNQMKEKEHDYIIFDTVIHHDGTPNTFSLDDFFENQIHINEAEIIFEIVPLVEEIDDKNFETISDYTKQKQTSVQWESVFISSKESKELLSQLKNQLSKDNDLIMPKDNRYWYILGSMLLTNYMIKYCELPNKKHVAPVFHCHLTPTKTENHNGEIIEEIDEKTKKASHDIYAENLIALLLDEHHYFEFDILKDYGKKIKTISSKKILNRIIETGTYNNQFEFEKLPDIDATLGQSETAQSLIVPIALFDSETNTTINLLVEELDD